MDAHRYNRSRTQPVWFSPFLLAVALFPAFLQFQYSCNRGDTYLLPLQVEVGGYDQIESFHPDTRYYDIAISADGVLVRAVTRDPTSTATYQLYVDGSVVEAGTLGVGGGEAALGIPLGASRLNVSVRATLGGIGHYEVDIFRLPKFPCTEQGILDAIAFGGGPHFFGCNGPTTVVTQAEIVIDNDVILDGEGNLALDAASGHRVLQVTDTTTAELRRFTVTGGNSAEGGGGIDNRGGTLTLTRSTVSGNVAVNDGGGIDNTGTLTLTDSTVSDNLATRLSVRGGGINSTGPLTLMGSTVSGNSTGPSGLGGGIFNADTATLTNSLVSGNTGTHGGGFFNTSAATLTLVDTTVSGNGGYSGGGIDNFGRATLIDSTVWGNTAIKGGGGIANGISARLTLTNSTVSSNVAGDSGGGIWNDARVVIANGTVSGNTAVSSGDAIYNDGNLSGPSTITLARTILDGDCFLYGGESSSNGYNIESPGDTCGFDQATDQVNVTTEDLSLGPLADNGGPTETHALLPGSVAIDWIEEAACLDPDGAPLTTDQRGVSRPQGSACDAGALEWADCTGTPCDDGNDCTVDHCDPLDTSWCAYTTLADGTLCDFAGGPGECIAGSCEDAPGWGAPDSWPTPDFAGGESTLLSPSGVVVAATGWVVDPTLPGQPYATFSRYAYHLVPSEGWSDSTKIGGVTHHPYSSYLGIDAQGNAMFLWSLYTHTGLGELHENRFTPENGWGGFSKVGGLGAQRTSFRAAMADDGSVTVIGEPELSPPYRVGARRFTPTDGWGAPGSGIVADLSGIASERGVAVGPNDHAIVFWSNGSNSNGELWSSSFDIASGWGPAEMVGLTSLPWVQVNGAGRALAVWGQDDASVGPAWTKRYTPSVGWGAPEQFERDDVTSVGLPLIQLDDEGDELAVWIQSDQVWSNRLTTSGWGAPQRIDRGGTHAASNLRFDMNPAGEALAAWVQEDAGVYSIWWTRFTPDIGWRPSKVFEDVGATSSYSPSTRIAEDGTAVMLWFRDEMTWMSRFE